MTTTFEQSENKRFKTIFNLWVGSFGAAPNGDVKITVEELANITGMKLNTVKGHLRHDGTLPSWPNLQLYMKVLPAGFASSMMFGCGFHVVSAEEHEEQSSRGLMANMANSLAQMADDLRDGIHTEQEKHACAPDLIKLGAECTLLGHSWLGTGKPKHLKSVA